MFYVDCDDKEFLKLKLLGYIEDYNEYFKVSNAKDILFPVRNTVNNSVQMMNLLAIEENRVRTNVLYDTNKPFITNTYFTLNKLSRSVFEGDLFITKFVMFDNRRNWGTFLNINVCNSFYGAKSLSPFKREVLGLDKYYQMGESGSLYYGSIEIKPHLNLDVNAVFMNGDAVLLCGIDSYINMELETWVNGALFKKVTIDLNDVITNSLLNSNLLYEGQLDSNLLREAKLSLIEFTEDCFR